MLAAIWVRDFKVHCEAQKIVTIISQGGPRSRCQWINLKSKKEDWEDTKKYYNLVEQNDPSNIEAIFYSTYAQVKVALLEAETKDKRQGVFFSEHWKFRNNLRQILQLSQEFGYHNIMTVFLEQSQNQLPGSLTWKSKMAMKPDKTRWDLKTGGDTNRAEIKVMGTIGYLGKISKSFRLSTLTIIWLYVDSLHLKHSSGEDRTKRERMCSGQTKNISCKCGRWLLASCFQDIRG